MQVSADVHHGELLLCIDLPSCTLPEGPQRAPEGQAADEAGAQLRAGTHSPHGSLVLFLAVSRRDEACSRDPFVPLPAEHSAVQLISLLPTGVPFFPGQRAAPLSTEQAPHAGGQGGARGPGALSPAGASLRPTRTEIGECCPLLGDI